jgi:IPT/TIG domain
MFGLARLLKLAGRISWRPIGQSANQLPKRHANAVLAVEELEDRTVPTMLGQQLFPADYPWNQNIANAPVASNSAAVIAHIGGSIGLHPDWGEDSASNGSDPLYGIPYNVVHGNSVAHINVIIDNYSDESDVIAVPMPINPVVEGDYQNGPNPHGGGYNANQRGDSHLLVWDEDTNTAYEFFGVTRPSDATLFPDGNGFEAAHTDGMWHAAQESVWNMNADTFRTLADTSADAAGLSILTGLARPDEGLPTSLGGQGAINHAMRFTLPSGDVSPHYIYPASHVVGTSPGSTKLPFGARLRLMNTSAVNAVISTLDPEAQIIAHAMQQYGLVLADIGSSMYITGTSASQDASNNIALTWNMDDVLGLHALTASDFQVVNLTPVVTGLSSTGGSAGNTITITGQNFSGSAGHLAVLFGGAAATSVTYVDDSHITAIVPAGSGTVHVQVQSGVNETDPNNPSDNVNNPIFGYGTSAATVADQFTYAGLNATLPFTDSFSTGTQLSNYWHTQAGALTIVNGNATGQGTYDVATLNGINQTNVAVQAVVNVPAGRFAGLVTRYQGIGDKNMYFGMIISSGSGYAAKIMVNKNGVWTQLAASSIGTVGQGTLLFTTIGSTLRLFWQPTGTVGFRLVASATNTALSTGSVGMRIGQGAKLDNFAASVETLQNATLPFSENFSAGNYPINPGLQLSSYWQNPIGDMEIVNGKATGQTATNVAILNGVNQANVSVQAVVSVPVGQFAGLVARYQGTGDRNMYFGMIVSSGSGYIAKIFVNINGVWTQLAATSIGAVGQGTLTFTTIGTSLQLFWNGALVVSTNDTRLTTGSVGMRAGQGVAFTNFAATGS